MSRDIGSSNVTETSKAHITPVALVRFDFDTPVYVHSGIGNIVFESNTYLGVGELGSVSGVEESESLSPTAIALTLSGVTSTYITEALTAGRYGDRVRIYKGYKNTVGALVADPWLIAGGKFDHASIALGDNNIVSIVIQHDIAALSKKSGRRYTDEDQTVEFSGDTGFSFVHSLANQKLIWGGGVENRNPRPADDARPRPGGPRTFIP